MSVSDLPGSFGALLPEQFGKYALLGHLATGGMAEVWLARQLGMQGFEKIVVIKRARPELTDVETTQFFLDEARLVATLEHPNIAQVYEIGLVNGSYFFVMEYVDGADLRRLIEASLEKKRPISLGDALYIITHVCTALHYAHEKRDLEGTPLKIIHRDVSPSNVLISHDGAVKVCDFGIAKANNRRSEDTQSGVLKGKFSYMSPEQCQSKPIDRRSDVFSIGILLYELTTLSKLFRGGSDFAVMKKIIDAPIAPPSLRMGNYPPELEAIVMKALARSPADRYQTAQALQVDLEAFAREHKLAMSSIGIAKLVGSLFDKRNDAWIRAQRAHSDHFIEVGATSSGAHTPAFVAIGSAPSASGAGSANDPTAVLGGPGSSTGRPYMPAAATSQSRPSSTATVPQRRFPVLWLVCSLLAGIVALGVTVAEQVVSGTADRAAAAALTVDAERIASTFDAAASSAHIRADGIAAAPVLRAAIETDAATLADLVNTEMIFTANRGEALEVFQFRTGKPVSLLRLPRTAAALPALKGRDTRLRIDERETTIIASAPISGNQSKLGGSLVIAMPVDLTAIRRALEEHAIDATLTGLGSDLVLAGKGIAGATAAGTPAAGTPAAGTAAAGNAAAGTPAAGSPAAGTPAAGTAAAGTTAAGTTAAGTTAAGTVAAGTPAAGTTAASTAPGATAPGTTTAAGTTAASTTATARAPAVAPLRLAVPSRGEWNAGGATLVATPKRTPGLPWARQVRYMSGGLAVLLLLGFVVSLVRRPTA